MKLYRVTCRGMHHSLANSTPAHGIGYVVAETMNDAYRMMRDHLDTMDIGFSHDREMEKIELLAEDIDYPMCGTRLYM
jgi:hypothetical protein